MARRGLARIQPRSASGSVLEWRQQRQACRRQARRQCRQARQGALRRQPYRGARARPHSPSRRALRLRMNDLAPDHLEAARRHAQLADVGRQRAVMDALTSDARDQDRDDHPHTATLVAPPRQQPAPSRRSASGRRAPASTTTRRRSSPRSGPRRPGRSRRPTRAARRGPAPAACGAASRRRARAACPRPGPASSRASRARASA